MTTDEGQERYLACWVAFEAKEEHRWFIGHGFSDEEAKNDALHVAGRYWFGNEFWGDSQLETREAREVDLF